MTVRSYYCTLIYIQPTHLIRLTLRVGSSASRVIVPAVGACACPHTCSPAFGQSHTLQYAAALPPVLCNCAMLGKWTERLSRVCGRGRRQPSRCSVFGYGGTYDESCKCSCISRVSRVWKLHNARLRERIFQQTPMITLTWSGLVCW